MYMHAKLYLDNFYYCPKKALYFVSQLQNNTTNKGRLTI